MYALGLIEVKGYLRAVQIADVALKAANVKLINLEKIRGGFVTVQITGDVGAVKAAVEAVQTEQITFNSHVIARLHPETTKILKNKDHQAEKKKPVTEVSNGNNVTIPDLTNESLDRKKLENLTVMELRKKIRESKGIKE